MLGKCKGLLSDRDGVGTREGVGWTRTSGGSGGLYTHCSCSCPRLNGGPLYPTAASPLLAWSQLLECRRGLELSYAPLRGAVSAHEDEEIERSDNGARGDGVTAA